MGEDVLLLSGRQVDRDPFIRLENRTVLGIPFTLADSKAILAA